MFDSSPTHLSMGFDGADQLYGLPSTAGHHLAGHVDRAAPAVRPADRVGRDQRQARRRQRLGGYQHQGLRGCANRVLLEDCRRASTGRAHRGAARGPLRDDPAAVGGRGHDDLPDVDHGGPGRARGAHRPVGARGRTRIGEKLSALPLTLYSDPAALGRGIHAVRRDPVRRSRCRSSTTAWTRTGSTGSVTAPSTRSRTRGRRRRIRRRWPCGDNLLMPAVATPTRWWRPPNAGCC